MRIMLLMLCCLCAVIAGAGEIHTAVVNGNLKAVQALLEKDPTLVNAPNDAQPNRGRTPIFYALTKDRGEILKLLIAKGADVNARDLDGATPLTWLAHPDAMRVLIEAGATINFVPLTQMAAPPLIKAAQTGDVALVQEMLAHGADINIRAYADGNSALHRVASMEDGSNVDPATGKWKSGFGMVFADGSAAWHPVETMLTFLIEHGALLEARNALGETPLYKAVDRGMLKHTQLLLKAGANPHAYDGFGRPVFFAASTPELLDLFITQLKVNPDTPNILTGLTYLQTLRAREDRRDINTQRLLLARGATEDGHNIPAAYKEQVAAEARFLALVRADDVAGMAAALKATPALLNAFAREGHGWLEQGNSALHLARSRAMVECLLNAGLPVNARNLGGYTPLHLAAQRGDLVMARLLLEQKANPNARTVNYDTPLHLAVLSKTPAMVALLIEFHADPRLRNHLQLTPLEKLQKLPAPPPEMLAAMQAAQL